MGDTADPVLIIGPPALRKTLLRFAHIDPVSYTFLITNSVATMDQNGEELVWSTDKVGFYDIEWINVFVHDGFQATSQPFHFVFSFKESRCNEYCVTLLSPFSANSF